MEQELQADIVIIGGGLGGCAAAMAAAKSGKSVLLTEETAWIGGQITSQAVPPDEHPWIEQFGCTRSYRQFREGIRSYYRNHFPLKSSARGDALLNPGNGIVSRLCAEPRAALAVLTSTLAPYVHSGRLRILTRHKVISADTDQDRVCSVTVKDLCTGTNRVLQAAYFLDATECGDLLPLTGTEYITGAESAAQTGEPHALSGNPQPMDMQAFTYCFAMDYCAGENHTIDKPQDYSFWKQYRADFWPDRQLSWSSPNPVNLSRMQFSLFPQADRFPLFPYRRIIDQNLFQKGTYASDITLANWPQNDYWLGSIIDVRDDIRDAHLRRAKQLSLSLLYWLQTEAPRPDGGGIGYPGLRLRKDVVGTEDGLAMYPYIRESRRIKAKFTVLEQHVSATVRSEQGAAIFHDSVGVGSYRIDLHPSTGGRTFLDISSLPFQIPLGSLIPVRMDNLLAACKNIGTTHITNGCYRLHPVEWNIGEAAGYLAAYCLQHGLLPRQVRNRQAVLEDFQKRLVGEGFELSWPRIRAI